jgi:hypothetical protein
MLTGKMNRGKTEVTLREAGYKVVAVMFFGKKEVWCFLNDKLPALVSRPANRRKPYVGIIKSLEERRRFFRLPVVAW